MKKIHEYIATVCGVGHLTMMPGTWGSLAGLAPAIILHTRPILCFIIFLAFFLIGVISSGKVEEDSNIKDPSFVVIDEFAGILLIFLFIPVTVPIIIVGFVLYRVFDIVKVPPARAFEKIKGGWGIMLDDLASAVYTNITLHLLLLIFRR